MKVTLLFVGRSGSRIVQPIDFDRQHLLRQFGGDAAAVRERIGLFLEEAPAQWQAVRVAIAQGQPDALRRAAHALEGTLLRLSAVEAGLAAEGLELLGRQGKLAEA